ncbi:O-antigen ligase family protein [uncultured Desulfobulbus sp.]|uniref:O-antigen ligase family protein n=1 Tax=uncultured Desulfobulbus sp. TaxID=239745 RepID=UPI0029C99D9D|nr:O-antigen ligase family protein [uncultured Desulfobulbus sp.]
MEDVAVHYLYQPNIVIELIVLAIILLSVVGPERMTAVTAAVMLLRPNERFHCFISSYPIVVFCTMFMALIFFGNKDSHGKQLKCTIPLLLFIAIIIFQTILFRRHQFINNMLVISPGLLLYFAIISFSTNTKGAKLLSCVVLISCFLICAEALYYHYSEPVGSVLYNFFHGFSLGRPDLARLQAWGQWGNANETAFIACVGSINATFLCVQFKQKLYYAVTAVLIPIFVLVVYLTGSRAGLATFVIFFLALIFLIKFNFSKLIIMLFLGAVVVFSSSFAPERPDSKGSTEERLDLRYGGIQVFKAYPLIGVGFQNLQNELGGMVAHNTFVQAFAETGLIGACFLIYYLYKVGLSLYQVLCSHKNNRSPTTNVAVVVGLYLSSLFYFFWGNQLLSLLFYLIFAQVHSWLQLIEKDRLARVSTHSTPAGQLKCEVVPIIATNI